MDQWGVVDREVARLFYEEHFNPYTTPPNSELRHRVQAQLADLLLARLPDFITIDYRAPIIPGEDPDPRWVLPITMRELFDGMESTYSFRRAFTLMEFPPKVLLLYERSDRQ